MSGNKSKTSQMRPKSAKIKATESNLGLSKQAKIRANIYGSSSNQLALMGYTGTSSTIPSNPLIPTSGRNAKSKQLKSHHSSTQQPSKPKKKASRRSQPNQNKGVILNNFFPALES